MPTEARMLSLVYSVEMAPTQSCEFMEARRTTPTGVDGACGVGVDAPLVRPDQLTFVVAVHAAIVRVAPAWLSATMAS